MEKTVKPLVGTTVVFEDAYTGAETYGRIIHVSGDSGVIRKITKEEAGANPRRIFPKPAPQPGKSEDEWT